jgi:hypothetical protein
MKKNILKIIPILIMVSCTKNPLMKPDNLQSESVDDTLYTILVSKKKVNTLGNKVPYGTTQDLGKNISGVSAITGYEPLVKHLNQSGVWDNTYDFVFYGKTLNVNIATYSLNAAYGDPLYAASIRAETGAFTDAAPFTGNISKDKPAPTGCFNLNYGVWNITSVTYTPPPFSTFDAIANGGKGAYINNNLQGTWDIAGGGGYIIHDYGKFIKTNTGTGLAVAEVEWTPITYPASTTSAVVNIKNLLSSANPATPNPISVDFLQNGNLVSHNNFTSTRNTAFGISVSPGTYQLRFNAPFPYNVLPMSYILNGNNTNLNWNTPNTSAQTLTTGNIIITAGIVYSLTQVDAL